MTKHSILFIDLDTQKTFIEVAYIEDQRGAKLGLNLALNKNPHRLKLHNLLHREGLRACSTPHYSINKAGVGCATPILVCYVFMPLKSLQFGH